jgi:uncharacterized protein YjbI with pentapeptide repeats
MPDPQYDIPNDPDVTPEDIHPGAKLLDADLTEADLRGADLSGANLGSADLSDATLAEAVLTDANLWRADLTGANLRGADLIGADLRGAHLTDTNLSDADLTGAYITNTQLTDAQLTDARFDYTIPNDEDVSPRDIISQTSLPDADLSGATLADASLGGADLTGAVLTDADLTDAVLGGADLTGASLGGADLIDADLRRADLIDADLRRADLSYADLRRADLTGADLASASLDHVRLYETSLEGISINEGTTATPPSRWELEADDAAESWLGWFDRKGFYWLRFLGRSASDQDDLQKAEQQYRRLERLYREADLSRDSALEIQQKHARRKRALAAGRWGEWLRKAFARWVLGYGLRIRPIIGMMLLIIGVWTLLYPVPGIADRSLADSPTETRIVKYETVPPSLSMETFETLRRSLYFSTITFSTLGYADVAPVRWGRELATVESFVGALLMAYLVSVLSRRAIR